MSNLCENAFFFCLTGVSLATIWGGRRVSWGGGAAEWPFQFLKSRLYSLDDYHQPVVLQEVQRVLRVMGQKMTSDLSLMLLSLQCSFFSGWIHTELYACKNSFILESLGKCSSQMDLGVEWIAVLQAIHLRNALRIVHSNHTMWLPWICVSSWTVRIPHPPGWSKISM